MSLVIKKEPNINIRMISVLKLNLKHKNECTLESQDVSCLNSHFVLFSVGSQPGFNVHVGVGYEFESLENLL